MAKNRRKKRRKRQGGQAAAAQPPVLRPSRVAPEERPDVVAARPNGPGTEGTVVGTVVEVEREFIWLDTGGERAMVYASELMLGIGERPADRYAVGDRFEAVVFQMGPEPESGATQFSIRRASPYSEALADLEVGTEVQATVVNTYDAGIELEIGGMRGNIFVQGLPLSVGESTHERYQPGDQINVGIHAINVEDRALELSARQYAPGYIEALQRRAVGDVVSATVTDIDDDNWLWLDADGLVGSVEPDELVLADGESARERYTVGQTIKDLFVRQVSHEARDLGLSVKRNAPGYVEALQRRAVGDVVSGTITHVDDGLWLDVGGLVGSAGPRELDLADGESARERYTVGQTIKDLFVRQVSHEARDLGLSVKRNAPGYVEALQRRAVGDVVSGTITHVDDGLRFDVNGLVGYVSPNELDLAGEKSAQDRYAVGETIEGLFIEGVSHEFRILALSVKRNAPGYVEALQRRAVGDVVSGTITHVDDGLWLDVDGLVGSVAHDELVLADGESARERYTVGETIKGLFVWGVSHEARDLGLSVKRNTPGYVEALQRRAVGEVVSATITAFQSNGGLWLDVDGLVGAVGPQELGLAEGESAQERYAVGETIEGLVVWQIDHEARDLALSVKRNAPGYLEALQRRAVGEVVSATITGFPSNGGLWLDVDGLVGGVPAWELDLADGESARERYAVGETIEGLFVRQIDHEARDLALSVKRNAPGYLEALDGIARGDEIDGVVAETNEWGGWLDVAGVVGWIPASELALDDGESPQTRYATGDPITARVWQIDPEARDIILSVRRLDSDFPEETITKGAVIDAVVRGTPPRGTRSPIRVLADGKEIWIPPHVLSLSTAVPPPFKDNQGIRVVVTDLDEHDQPAKLSHRRTLEHWAAEVERLTPGTLVTRSRVLPRGAIPDAEDRLAVDLGALTGIILADELDRDAATNLIAFGANEVYPVVVESVNADIGNTTTVSHDRFEERWRELAAGFEVGEEVEGELRDFDGEIALLDLGSGLLAQMPARELPDSDPPGKAVFDRIGERFPLQITAVDRDKLTIHVKHQWIESLIGEPESEILEFKEVLRGDPDADDAKEMTRQAMRTINAFLNTEGGRLIIGVHDVTREVTGLEGDPGLDADTIEKKIDQATQMLEANLANLEPRDLLNDDLDGLIPPPDTPSVRGGTLLVITCKRGPDAGVNLVIKGKPEFWVREGSSKKQLRTQSEIRDHLRTRQQRSAAGDAASDD